MQLSVCWLVGICGENSLQEVVRQASWAPLGSVIGLSYFDEGFYCALVRKIHRYSLAEIVDNKTDLANKNAGLRTMVGSLLGLIFGNIFAPFLGHSYGKNISNRGSRVEEFLPDLKLLFCQDENSYLCWSKSQVISPRLRHLISVQFDWC
jgi:hypothetical protein